MCTKNCIILLAFLVACGAYEVPETVKALGWDLLDFQQLPTPADLTFGLSDDEFEDYLNFWLQKKTESSQKNTIFQEDIQSRIGPCKVNVNNLKIRQPVYVSNGVLLAPSDNLGNIDFVNGQSVTMACPVSGNFLIGPGMNNKPQETILYCNGDNLFLHPDWVNPENFNSMYCANEAVSTEKGAGICPSTTGGTIITVGFEAAGQTHTIIRSCIDLINAKVFYVEYDQSYNTKRAIADKPTIFKQGPLLPAINTLNLQTLYTQNSQAIVFDKILFPGAANLYLGANFLTRGHLAAAADFVFSPAQVATYTYMNVAPQWNFFNGGNWGILEENLRARIGELNAKTKIYTGTFGNLQLNDDKGIKKNIYLSYPDSKIPVPLWFYKVVHNPAGSGTATVFLGLNNPHVNSTEAAVEAKKICTTDQCSTGFSWLKWQKTNTVMGYSICCTLVEFRKIVTHLPSFTVGGLFT